MGVTYLPNSVLRSSATMGTFTPWNWQTLQSGLDLFFDSLDLSKDEKMLVRQIKFKSVSSL